MSMNAAQAFQAIEASAENFWSQTVLPAAKKEISTVEASQQYADFKAKLLADLRSAESTAIADAGQAAAAIEQRLAGTPPKVTP